MPDRSRRFTVKGMHCAGCAANVTRAVSRLPGASEVYVNFAVGKLSFRGDPAQIPDEAVVNALKKLGFQAEPIRDALPQTPTSPEPAPDARRFGIAALFSVLLAAAMLLPVPGVGAPLRAWLQLLFLLPVLVAGKDFFTGGFAALLRGMPEMASLIACGSGAAAVYSFIQLLLGEYDRLYFDASAMIVTLVMLGKLLEARSRQKAGNAVRELMDLAPPAALKLTEAGEVEVPASELAKGDRFRVKPGMRIPADGIVEEGRSAVDESMLTGESVPVPKGPGDALTGGAVNGSGSLIGRVTAERSDSTLARIIALVEEAQGSRPPAAQLADRVAGGFVWAVLGIALLTFLLWAGAGAGLYKALNYGLSVMVIACPCALGLATPIALIAGVGKGARSGILIKSGAALETAARVTTVFFDKTGTLTAGKPAVRAIRPAEGFNQEELLQSAASVETGSEHPLGSAIRQAAAERGLSLLPATEFQSVPGKGASARIGGVRWDLGSEVYLREAGVPVPTLTEEGASVICLTRDGVFAGVILAEDPPKPGASEAIRELREMGVKTVLLSGDRPAAAEAVGRILGMDEVRGGLLPEAKVAVLKESQKHGLCIAMVGDGVNDAPALAAADLGIALGSGTAAAMEAASLILPGSEPERVASALKLCRRTRNVIRQNLFWAFFYNLLGIPLAAGVFAVFGGPGLNPMIGAGAMAASSLTVVLNALRLLR